MASKLITSFLLALAPSLLPKKSTGEIAKSALSWRLLFIFGFIYLVLPIGCGYFSDTASEYSKCVSDVSESFEENFSFNLGDNDGIL